jgi:uncharacterized protein (TIGR03083 family)
VNDADISEAIAAERRELAEALGGLPSPSWDKPSLCAGWRVREVVAHMTMPFRYSTARFMMEMARSRGNFNRMSDRCARRDAAVQPGGLVATLRDSERHPWKPPGGGLEGALTHDVIHGLDITVALGTGRRVPEERLRIVLGVISRPKPLKFFGADLNGIELRADDMDWSFGSGTPVSGPAQDLALVLCGRRVPAGLLRGRSGRRFAGACHPRPPGPPRRRDPQRAALRA